jgi:hypothetical protein
MIFRQSGLVVVFVYKDFYKYYCCLISISYNLSDIPNLNWDVFVTPGIPIATNDLPPGVREAYFQAIASTIIYGKQDAVLVDAYMTVKQTDTLAGWVAASGKNLTTIYITHGHGDHWLEWDLFLNAFQMPEQ